MMRHVKVLHLHLQMSKLVRRCRLCLSHSPHRTKSTRSLRLMVTHAVANSSNIAVEFVFLLLNPTHFSKILNVAITESLVSRVMSSIVGLGRFSNAPSWNCSVGSKLCCANFIRKVLSSTSRKTNEHQL